LRDIVFTAVMIGLLPLAVARPFIGVLLWSWISFMNPHREIWGPASHLPWAAIVFGATALGCLVAREPRRFESNAVTLLLLLLMACFTLTSATALGSPALVWSKWDGVFKALLMLLLTAALLTDRQRIHAMVWMMAIAIGFYGVKGGLFTVLNGGSNRVYGPPESMIFDNNHMATAMLVSLPLMNYLRLQSRHRLVRWGLVAAMVLTLFATVGSYSRGALLGCAAVALVLWWRSRHKLIGGAVIAAALVSAITFMPQQWVDRMNTLSTYEEDASAMTRLELWETSLKLALSRPLLGTGFTGPYQRAVVDRVDPSAPARAVHSIWFELLAEHGFPTFFAWVGLTLAGLAYALRLPRLVRGRPELAWAGDLGSMVQVCIVAYAVGGSFLSLSYWDYYWTILAVVAAAHALVLRSLRQEAPASAPAWRPPAGLAAPVPVGSGARRASVA